MPPGTEPPLSHPGQVIVRLDDDGDHDESEPLPFRGPLAEPDQQPA